MYMIISRYRQFLAYWIEWRERYIIGSLRSIEER